MPVKSPKFILKLQEFILQHLQDLSEKKKAENISYKKVNNRLIESKKGLRILEVATFFILGSDLNNENCGFGCENADNTQK